MFFIDHSLLSRHFSLPPLYPLWKEHPFVAMAPASFDFDRLKKSNYRGLTTAVDSGRLQETFMDFVTWLKSNPRAENEQQKEQFLQAVRDFNALLNPPRAWALATMVVPEFRETKYVQISVYIFSVLYIFNASNRSLTSAPSKSPTFKNCSIDSKSSKLSTPLHWPLPSASPKSSYLS